MSNEEQNAWNIQANLAAVQHLAESISKLAKSKGFWNSEIGECDGPQGILIKATAEFVLLRKSQKIALMHSELSELLEELRKPAMPSELLISNEEEELADLIIRALDYAGHYGLNIGLAIGVKMAKNEGRPYMHGKAF